MNPNDLPVDAAPAEDATEHGDASLLSSLLQGAVSPARESGAGAKIHGVVVGELLALSDEGVTPLVRYPGQSGSAAVRARS
ncbi:MAG: hypothetical protein M3Z29_08385, partial [Pseudomonadota bacterium]|nr:hypothetical protein [Pseudomonadota bacterium]